MKLNRPSPQLKTHEGAPAKRISPELQLRRSIMSCLLWEKEFYENGEEISTRIAELIPKVSSQKVADMAIEAREKMKLRHMPLFIVREMARIPDHKKLVGSTLERVIQRADELTEFLAIYWKDKKQPLSKQVKIGLRKAFTKFDAYQLAKYNRDGFVKLRDVAFLTHVVPKDMDQGRLIAKLVNKEFYPEKTKSAKFPVKEVHELGDYQKLSPPDTWEVELSAGKDKKQVWERLLQEKKLGAFALLRNLRNMDQANVSQKLILDALENMKVERVLPFRFIAAARYATQLEPQIEKAMFKCLEGMDMLKGHTAVVVDVSGSMDYPLSPKSEMLRMDAAMGLAILARELCEAVSVYAFSNDVKLIPLRRGFALRDSIKNSMPHGGTDLGHAVSKVMEKGYDRIIVLTDEQSHQPVPDPKKGYKAYMINVASAKNGVGYGSWIHIDGWSEAVLNYIQQYEGLEYENEG